MRSSVLAAAMAVAVGFLTLSSNLASAQSTEAVIDKAKEIEAQLAKNETIKELSAGLLQPIYDLAEYMSHPWFYWIAFAVMSTGVVSFALQLVLTKLILLSRLKLSLSEILSDGLGLLVSLTGLVMVTQAATENSNFTSQAVSVVSAAAVGLVAGFVFYLWGQKTELRAAKDPQIVVQRDDAKYKL